jgi:AbrB family looped-hinge helix DNA binding protein
MRLNSKGQVTIPADLRHSLGFREGDEVDVIADGDTLRIIHAPNAESRGHRVVSHMRGEATTSHSTDELMTLLRADSDE